ncbi:hypothetical protein O0I10_004876 [Lichtheimia ornata]|uniref:PSMD12/CSN4-like N-terminal domain-containing protein n=1 Tax=Lichtheimia ornata TaxID=688661 RepID=A0AAD7Y045_9FUNG|nr:uncharacterized protein O0I10_004876 [Lichtheimia ornata]KAJ8659511.1 hypothetical protein O0I10_004876 [Lichtheimia ornata]
MDITQETKIDIDDVLASSAVGPAKVQNLKEYIQCVLNEQVGLVVARQLLSEFITLFNERVDDNEVKKQVLTFAIELAQPRSVSFEEQLSQLRENLAKVYEDEEDYLEAAKALQSIQLDSGHRSISDEYKLGIYVRIMRLLLEVDEAVTADTYLNRAALLIHNSNDLVLNSTFKLCQARILDAKRRFLEAAIKFHELIYETQIDEFDRLQCLMSAVQCAVLAGAGPQRSHSLATLYKDERTHHHLASSPIFETTCTGRVIGHNEVADFFATLQQHHRAIRKHNLLSASKIYNNITLDEHTAY